MLPNLLAMIALRTGGRLAPQVLVEEAERQSLPEHRQSLASTMLDRWVVAGPETAAKQVRELAYSYEVDEVMVHPVAGAFMGTPADRGPAREETLRLLAEGLDKLDHR